MSQQWITTGGFDGAGYWQEIEDAPVPAKAAVATTPTVLGPVAPPQTTSVLSPGVTLTSPGPDVPQAPATAIAAPTGIAAAVAEPAAPTPWVPPDASYEANSVGGTYSGFDGQDYTPYRLTGGYTRFAPGSNNEMLEEYDNNGNFIRTTKRANASDLSGLASTLGSLATLYFGGGSLINGLTNMAAGTPWAVAGSGAGTGAGLAGVGGDAFADIAAENAASGINHSAYSLDQISNYGTDPVTNGPWTPDIQPNYPFDPPTNLPPGNGPWTPDVIPPDPFPPPTNMSPYTGLPSGTGLLPGLGSGAGGLLSGLGSGISSLLGGTKGTDLLKLGLTAATLAGANNASGTNAAGAGAGKDTSGEGLPKYAWDPKTRTYTLTKAGTGANSLGYTQGQQFAMSGPGTYQTGYRPRTPFSMAAGGTAPSGLQAGADTQSRYIEGPGTGLSDDIPVQMDDGGQGRLANNEFVVSADVVSGLGGGSSAAGAKLLYGMMDRIRKQAHGTTKQIKPVDPRKVLPA